MREREGGIIKRAEVEVSLTCGYICEIGDRALTTETTIVSLSHIYRLSDLLNWMNILTQHITKTTKKTAPSLTHRNLSFLITP